MYVATIIFHSRWAASHVRSYQLEGRAGVAFESHKGFVDFMGEFCHSTSFISAHLFDRHKEVRLCWSSGMQEFLGQTFDPSIRNMDI